jgi:hypothetical protein
LTDIQEDESMKGTCIIIICVLLSSAVIVSSYLLFTESNSRFDEITINEKTIDEIVKNNETLMNKKVVVSGYVVRDIRAKPEVWPEPARLCFILQNESGTPVYAGGGRNVSAIAIYSNTTNLLYFEDKYVCIEGYLRKILVENPYTGKNEWFLYIDVEKIWEK